MKGRDMNDLARDIVHDFSDLFANQFKQASALADDDDADDDDANDRDEMKMRAKNDAVDFGLSETMVAPVHDEVMNEIVSKASENRVKLLERSSDDNNDDNNNNKVCAKAFIDRKPCRIVKKMPECVGDSFQFGNMYWTASKRAVEKYKNDQSLKNINKLLVSKLPTNGPFDGLNENPYETCAIVASSKAMSGKKLGNRIDSNEAVMRMNGAPTKGFEIDVGKRTTFRVQHGGYFGWRENPKEVLLGKWAAGRRDSFELEKMIRAKVHAINPSFARKTRTDWFTKRDHLPTQGFRAMLILLASCKEVTAYGFSGGAGWYFDKIRNRGPADKRAHGTGTAKNAWFDAPTPANSAKKNMHRTLLSSSISNYDHGDDDKFVNVNNNMTLKRRRRKLLAVNPRTKLPTTHKLSVEHECINQLIKAKIIKKG